MDFASDLIKILLPAGLAVLGMYLVVESMLRKQFEKSVLELRAKNTEIILPIRLQAYERIALLLERITPHNLILRVNQQEMRSVDLQQVMLRDIREEFNHNLSQQIYMSEVSWGLVRGAVEDVVSAINVAAQQVDPESPAIELARKIFEYIINQQAEPTQKALQYIKEEIGQVF